MQNIKIILYTWPHCPFCIQAKHILDSYHLIYEDHNIYDKNEIKNELISRTGQKTVPYIFFNDQLIGGYSELAEMENNGQLLEILECDKNGI